MSSPRLPGSKGLLLPIIIGGLASSLYSTMSSANLKETLDWVAYDQLTPEQQSQLPVGSCGAYISPLSHLKPITDDTLLATEASANKSEIIEKEGFKHITLIGDVLVKRGAQQLTANEAIYSEQTGSITIEGELTVRQPDLLLLANKGIVNQRENRLAIDDATYVIHSANVRGKGKKITKNKEILDLQGSEYTSCEPDNNNWLLRGSQITIDTEKNQGVAKHVRLVVEGIPVFYWPYLRFPVGNDRQSGFLFPVIKSSDGAIDVSIPYYFNLAPNYDLTLTPHFLQDHGTQIEASGRHLNRHFETDITLVHLSNDKGVLSDSEQSLVDDGSKTADEINPFRGDDRWLVSVRQAGGKGQPWFSTIDYNEVSDNNYLDDFDNASGVDSTNETRLSQQITAGYQFEHWRLSINNQQYQVLNDNITRPYKLLPEINFDGAYSFSDSTLGDVNLTFDNEWTNFAHSDSDNPGDTTPIGNRTRLKYAVELDKTADAGFFRPRLQARHLSYQLDASKFSAGTNTSTSITVPQAVIDSGLYFEREGNTYQQTFEPRLFYFYSPFKDQSDIINNINFDTSSSTFSYSQLFRDTRFAGGDRIDDANQVSVGLTTRFIGNSSGREWFSASIGKAFYLEERQVTLSGARDTDNNSPIAGRFSSQFSQHWQLNNDFIYNDDTGNIDDNTLSLKYRGSDSSLFNVSHRFLRSDIAANTTQQTQVSAILPIAKRSWYVFAHADYDHTNERDLEQLAGIEYNSCCYRARFAYKRSIDDDQVATGNNSIDYDQRIILEFQLLGLGSTSKQFNNLFKDNIDGYEQWEATYRDN